MAWTLPITWNPGYLVAAADLNPQVRDNLNFLAGPFDTATGKINNLITSVLATISGMISSSVTSASNSGSTETVLITATLTGGAMEMNTNGNALRITSWGTCTNSANAKIVKQYFGVSLHGFSGMLTNSLAVNWWMQSLVVRITATTQTAWTRFAAGATDAQTNVVQVATSAPNQTLASNVTMKTTGQGGASNEVTALGQAVESLRP